MSQGRNDWRASGISWRLLAGVAALTFVLQLWLFNSLVLDYFPTLDEIAMQAGSTDIGGPVHASNWFTHGLHGFFVPFPEWNSAVADYWRPLANVWYWINHLLWDYPGGNQLLTGYLAHALVTALTCYVAARLLAMRGIALLLVVAIAALNPAYVFHNPADPFGIPRAIQYPVYQLEVLDALLMLIAIMCFLRRRYATFGLVALAAVLLKETALALPVSALLLLLGWPEHDRQSRIRHLYWVALPLAGWMLGRLVAFAHGATHVLPSASLAAWISRPLRNLMLWPTGLHQDSLSVTRAALTARDWATVARYAFELLVNLGWWAALAAAAVAGYRSWRRRQTSEPPEPWLVLLIFAAGNLLFALVTPISELRYGYLWFALGPAAIFVVLARARYGVLAMAALGLCLLVPQALSLSHSVSDAPLTAYRTARESARALTSLVGTLPSTVRRAYIVDDMAVQSSSPQYFAKFAGFDGEIVLVNNLVPVAGCKPAGSVPQRYRLRDDGSSTVLDYSAPDCFTRAWNVAPLDQIDSGGFIQRGRWMNYRYPELRMTNPWRKGDPYDYDPGRRWTVRVSDPLCWQSRACVWLGFDPVGRRYYALGE
jgi:hypothetical protein